MFQLGGLPKPFIEQTQMFAETALMVREPAIEIINNLKSTDFQKPAVRYLLCIFLIFTIYFFINVLQPEYLLFTNIFLSLYSEK